MEQYICECGKAFSKINGMTGHQANCKVHKTIILKKRETKRLPNGMFKCENLKCNKEHDGSYGSGRFCCKACSQAFNSSHVKKYATRDELIKRNFGNKPAEYGQWKCKCCNSIFLNRKLLQQHNKEMHLNSNHKKYSWNRGKTKETCESIAKGVQTLKVKYKSGKLVAAFKGMHHSDKTKQQLSNAMKKAHAEGRANNFALSRHSCGEVSYPEKWFMTVIKNEFDDQNYIKEYPFIKYSLDFAWPHKKICIEIDGSQHYDKRFQNRIEHDIKRDLFIKSKGWKILRLRWTYVLKQKKYWIRVAKKFVDGELVYDQ